ncbi:MAG: FHA domain-containing protein [Planctomycetota bacterium]
MSRARNRTVTELRSPLVSSQSAGGLRARLVRTAAPPSAFPFRLVHEGRFARILLAELVGANGVAQDRFAWKLRVDAVTAASGRLRSNAEQDRAWELERAELLRVRSPNVVASVPVPAALTTSPPVFYCRRVDEYFHPVCPATGRVLRVCRNDDVLASAGLPSYAKDHVRYLHAGGQHGGGQHGGGQHGGGQHGGDQHGEAGAEKTFYRVGEDRVAVADGVQVHGFHDLVRAWGSRLRRSVLEEPSEQLDLPCTRCEHRAACYATDLHVGSPEDSGPEGSGPKGSGPKGSGSDERGAEDSAALPAERELLAISFYDVDSIAIELAATDFDAAMTRLGGGGGAGGPSGASGMAEPVWMAAGDARSVPLESLRLKLSAFADVCRGVLALHEAGRPHLGVSPANLVALDASAGCAALPANWRMRFALTDLGGAIPVVVAGSEETLWQPGHEVVEDETSRLFLSPMLRFLEGGTVTMAVEYQRAESSGQTDRVIVHRAGVPSYVLPGDLLVVRSVDGHTAFAARIDEVSAKGLVADVLRDANEGRESPQRGEADDGAGVSTLDARLSFVRRSGPAADLYGLGMLLLRVLLVHDEQTLPQVAAAVERCLQILTNPAAMDEPGALEDRWLDLLDGEAGEGRFASWHVMHGRGERQEVFDAELQGHAIIPAAIWRSLLTLAGRLLIASPLARAPGVGASGDSGAAGSGASRVGGKQAAKPASPVVGVLAEIETTERHLHVELFGREARDATLVSLCRQRLVSLRGELRGSVSGSEAGLAAQALGSAGTTTTSLGPLLEASEAAAEPRVSEGGPGFVLAVGRAGAAGIRQYHFDQDRVTIGRREDGNVLLLADAMVSSKHAVIEWSDGEYTLFDRGSTNGTEVDGIRLPVEVAHPLGDGSVIHIRPFMLSFRHAGSEALKTVSTRSLDAELLHERLRSVYVASVDRGRPAVHAALVEVFEEVRQEQGREALAMALEEILKKLGSAVPAAGVASGSDGDGDELGEAGTPLSDEALRALRQLVRNLTSEGRVNGVGREGAGAAELQEFAARMQQFVVCTSRWMADLLEWRRVFGKRLELHGSLGAAQADAAGEPARADQQDRGAAHASPPPSPSPSPPQSAAEIRDALLVPTGEGAAIANHFLTRFFEDVLALLEDLLTGNQRSRAAVREQLDPVALLAAAGRATDASADELRHAADSALWKLYQEAFHRITEGDRHEEELGQLVAMLASRRASRKPS